jgi:ElaB/YqjD/DUF883 family membrane-anchored ribosome-binding protein
MTVTPITTTVLGLAYALPERGTKEFFMADVLERADEQVAESIRRLSHATSSMAEAIDDGVGAIRLAVKRSGDLAEEIMDDTTQRVKRHPVETMVTTLAVGLLAGIFIGWAVSRR